MTTVLDASALLALINSEPGSEVVAAHLSQSIMSTVNVAEVGAVLSDLHMPMQSVESLLIELTEIIPFSEAQALVSMGLRALTKQKGLSLGDRACLALAKTKNATVLTADKAWSELNLGISIIQIR